MTGTTWEKKQVTADFTFTAPEIIDILGAPLTKATLPDTFVGLTSVEIVYSKGKGGGLVPDLVADVSEITGLFFVTDDFDYVTYDKKDCKSSY